MYGRRPSVGWIMIKTYFVKSLEKEMLVNYCVAHFGFSVDGRTLGFGQNHPVGDLSGGAAVKCPVFRKYKLRS